MRRARRGSRVALAAALILVASQTLADAPGEPVPQRDIFDVIHDWIYPKRIEPELEVTGRYGISWTVLPSLSYNPTYGFALGASVSGAGRVGPEAKPSAISISGNYSTTSQILAQAKGDIYSKTNQYLFKVDLRYLDTSRKTYGLGPISEDQQEYPMQFKLARYYATFYRVISGPVYLGLGFHYDDYTDIVDERAEEGEATPFTEYSRGNPSRTRSSGLSINLLGDTRDNQVNALTGYYLAGTFRAYLDALGSDDDWQETWSELRVYPHVPRRSSNVLAFWFYSWLTFGHAPYLALPSIGWDTYGRGGRGYLQGRIRGPNQIYIEAEYRMQLRRDGLLGAVGFLNATATTIPETGTFGRLDEGGGVGLRVKFNKRSNTNLAVDKGWGHSSAGWFLGLTEVF